jgi:hypothetical protein
MTGADDADRVTGPDLLRAYASTHCVLVHDGVRSLVAGPGPEPLPADLLFVVTAENPRSAPLPAAQNAARNAELEAVLRTSAWAVWTAIGEAADGSWAESGYAVAGADRAAIVAMGERFGQRAVFELDDVQQRIIGCLGAEKGVVLAARPRDWNAHRGRDEPPFAGPPPPPTVT